VKPINLLIGINTDIETSLLNGYEIVNHLVKHEHISNIDIVLSGKSKQHIDDLFYFIKDNKKVRITKITGLSLSTIREYNTNINKVKVLFLNPNSNFLVDFCITFDEYFVSLVSRRYDIDIVNVSQIKKNIITNLYDKKLHIHKTIKINTFITPRWIDPMGFYEVGEKSVWVVYLPNRRLDDVVRFLRRFSNVLTFVILTDETNFDYETYDGPHLIISTLNYSALWRAIKTHQNVLTNSENISLSSLILGKNVVYLGKKNNIDGTTTITSLSEFEPCMRSNVSVRDMKYTTIPSVVSKIFNELGK